MLAAAALLLLGLADTTIVLGHAERDLTGDGKPEVLRVVGSGRTVDSLVVTFTIVSGNDTLYRVHLSPLVRTVGYGSGRRVASADEHHRRLVEYGSWFFGSNNFVSPAAFVDELRKAAPGHIAEIPAVIERDSPYGETRSGADIWEEIRRAQVTIFTFSPGGDEIVAIGWSPSAKRFYRPLSCC